MGVELEAVFALQFFHRDLEMDFALPLQRHLLQFGVLVEMQRWVFLAQFGDGRGQLDLVLAIGGLDGEPIDRRELFDLRFRRRLLAERQRIACRHAFEPGERDRVARMRLGELGLAFALEREDAADARVAAVLPCAAPRRPSAFPTSRGRGESLPPWLE